MKIYLDRKSYYNLDNLKHRYKCLENTEIKDFEISLENMIATDLDNVYCQLIHKETVSFYLRSPQQISFLAKQIANDFNSHGATLRLSLSELMMNSLEHGNLRIDSNTKNEMIADGSYYDLLDNLIESNKHRYIEVEYKLDSPRKIIVKDQGDGFAFEEYLARHDIAENDEYCGRGIQIASVELPKNNATFGYLENGKTLVINFS